MRSPRIFCLSSVSAVALVMLLSSALAGSGQGTAQAQVPTQRTCALGDRCAIGDIGPGGGVVFITPSTMGNRTGKYFEAASKRWNGPAKDPNVDWCSDPKVVVTGATGVRIGTGATNTAAIVAVTRCQFGAAYQAAGYRGRGLADWFLPSKGELAQLWTQRAKLRALDLVGDGLWYYWSSTYCKAGYAWGQDMSKPGIGSKFCNYWTDSGIIRPVRMF